MRARRCPARNFGTMRIGIETRAPENFRRLFARPDESGFTYSGVTDDETVAAFILRQADQPARNVAFEAS
jgi:hypothetical protein